MKSDASSQVSMTRRNFFSVLSVGVAATIAMLPDGFISLAEAGRDAWVPSMKPDGSMETEERFFSEFAKVFTINPVQKYLMAAQKGSMPIPIMQRYKEGLDQIARDPFPVYLEPSEVTRAKIAKGYGAGADEIAIARNTTDAVSMILNGIDWKPGDELLTSTMEYPNCVAIMLHTAARFGVVIRQFGVPHHASASQAEVADSVRRRIRTGKTKAVFFSAINHPNGQRMPLRLIANIAQENGVITVVDGAHYGGMIVPDLDNTGIDFFGISGHKWQCGPGGTGILFARNARRISNPTPLPRFHMLRSGQLNSPVDGSRPDGFDIGATLSLYGFPESADWRALGEVCELWDLIGRDRIQNYILSLADYARAGLIRKFGEQCLMQPTKDQELKSGIIAFNPFPHKRRRDFTLSQHFQDHIFADYGYRLGMGGLGKNGLTRLPDGDAARFFDGCIPDRHAETNEPAPTDIPFRFSACIWLTRRDIDTFINVLEQAVSEMLVDIKQITV